MDFELNEEQRALVGLMKEFCTREVDRRRCGAGGSADPAKRNKGRPHGKNALGHHQ
jgi:hypothetical protein